MFLESTDTEIKTLGNARIPTSYYDQMLDKCVREFVNEKEKIVINVYSNELADTFKKGEEPRALEQAGPRKTIYFDPSKLRCALVTCGGLCPGLNDIIRSIVLELFHGYKVKNIYGIKYGLQGFIPKYGHEIMELLPESVENILDTGGTILGSSRGPQDIDEIVDSLERMNIGILFMIGGDGTLMAASKIADSITARGLKTSIIGIPKTIDNDIFMVSKSFGFDTAVDVATISIKGAHNEALAYHNGIGLIKLMGRHSGFIAATATLAQQDVNFTLVPEIDFDMEGPNGLLNKLHTRLKSRKHAVIVVAEGAGQKFFKLDTDKYDESGNIRLNDIGVFLKKEITDYFNKKDFPFSLKYIDPSYMIRSLSANANDSVFCGFLGRNAVHAGMAGKTKLIVSHWNNHFVHVPLKLSVGKRKQIVPNGRLWRNILEATGQGSLIN